MRFVFVRNDRCISLGANVSCDGFIPGRKFRVQTHVHEDHMVNFDTSKGEQTILMAQATKDLLIAEKDADLPYRQNILALDDNGKINENVDGSELDITFFPSGHMPGSIMPMVNVAGIGKVLYTSDFSWPLTNIPNPGEVDLLIIDSTYGKKELCREYNQEEAINSFVDLIIEMINKENVVVFTGHRGRLQWAAQLLTNYQSTEDAKFIFSTSTHKTIDTYMEYRGFYVQAIEFGSDDAKKIIDNNTKRLLFIETRDRRELDQVANSDYRRVFLSQFMVPHTEPIVERSGIITVGITDHADFNGTVDLIKTLQPKKVLCSNTNGGNSKALADFVNEELNIPASFEEKKATPNWGGGT